MARMDYRTALRAKGIVAANAHVVCILTGHLLKDPDATASFHSGKAARANPLRNTNGAASYHDSGTDYKQIQR